MSEVLEVSGGWLELREPEDARARSRDLALAAAGLLPEGPVTIHDLGSGTGSMMRWLAPLLAGPQTWVLHDWNAQLTAVAIAGARPRDRDGAPVAIRSRVGDLQLLDARDLTGASLVTASALLDVLTADEAHAIVDACLATGSPALFSLSVTGDVDLEPWDARDIRFARAFNAHQRRDVGGRRLLGRFGAPIVHGLFARAGWEVRKALTAWRLDGGEPELLAEWFDGWVDAAQEHSPELIRECAGYRRSRRAQQQAGDLSAVVYHLDVLARPR
jgi:hypothetical protein